MKKIVELYSKEGVQSCIFDEGTYTRNLRISINTKGVMTVCYSTIPLKGKRFSRVLLSAPKNKVVDHINGNPLDNRRCNLRLVTRQQNNFNRCADKNKKSNLPKGVIRIRGKYMAKLTLNGLQYHLGTYLTPEAASAAYKRKAEEMQGEFSYHLSRDL